MQTSEKTKNIDVQGWDIAHDIPGGNIYINESVITDKEVAPSPLISRIHQLSMSTQPLTPKLLARVPVISLIHQLSMSTQPLTPILLSRVPLISLIHQLSMSTSTPNTHVQLMHPHPNSHCHRDSDVYILILVAKKVC